MGAIVFLILIFAIILKKRRHSSAKKKELVDSLDPSYEIISEDSATALSKNKAYSWLPGEDSIPTKADILYKAPPAKLTDEANDESISADENAPKHDVLESNDETNEDGCCEDVAPYKTAVKGQGSMTVETVNASEIEQSIGFDVKIESVVETERVGEVVLDAVSEETAEYI